MGEAKAESKLTFLEWNKEFLKFILYVLSILVVSIVFYQVLPVSLLMFGQIMGLLGTSQVAPTIVDVVVFIPVAISLTSVLTYPFFKVVVHIWNKANGHRLTLRTDMMKRLSRKKKS